MSETTRLLSQFYLTLNGAPADEKLLRNLTEARVESSLHLPDVATLTLHDPDGKWVDHADLAPGAALKIDAKAGTTRGALFDGEIVELESDFVPGGRRVLVRAFDRLHRLARGRSVRSYLNVTDSDIISTIARQVGLSTRLGPMTTVHPYVLQDNLTNLDFLRQRAAALGYLLWVDGQVLHCEPLGEQSAEITLGWGEMLSEFHPRLTTVDQVSVAHARGWDPRQRREIIGTARNGGSAPQVGVEEQGGKCAEQAFGMSAEVLVADRPLRTQVMADCLAQATLDRRAGRFIEADGTAFGTPGLVAGVSVKLEQLGKRFSGTYFVTSATHVYGADTGYLTQFTVSGFYPSTLLALLAPETDPPSAARTGLVIGIVTDNNDPDRMGRVKVKFPWLSSDHASDWARVATPGGGPSRGLQFLPEVNDEVLVGFEQGNVNYPYVLGGLWNGQDAPPKAADLVAPDGKVKQRIIRSRTGHVVTLDDSDDKPGISIVDKTGKNKIEYDSTANKLTIHFEGDMRFEAPNGDINVHGKTVTMEATNAFSIKGLSFQAEAKQAAKLKGATTELEGTGSMKVKGVTTDIEASAKLGLNGGALLEARGGLIKLN